MMYALLLLMCGLALYGAYALSVDICRHYNKNCTYDEAKNRVNNFIIDNIIHRNKYYLDKDPIFQEDLMNIIRNILTESEYNRWFIVMSSVTAPIIQNKLPFFYILLYVPNDQYRFAFEIAISNLAKKMLRYHNQPDSIILDWIQFIHSDSDVNTTEYKWLCIRYAITQSEQETLSKIQAGKRSARIKAQSPPILRDKELDAEIKQMNNKNGDCNNGDKSGL